MSESLDEVIKGQPRALFTIASLDALARKRQQDPARRCRSCVFYLRGEIEFFRLSF
jgi:hypothetical protein